ncbi:DeoR family transcriptional regulator [Kitasatospora aureofaciens]|uniref:DeoR family transcriptional regulator n=1 Tax=Kitasatospora aureofaciens TaxID=1894 RepID=UPI0033E1A38E
MHRADRAGRILSHLTEAGSADVHALSELLEVSAATIRRGLREPHDRGLLRRTRGGASTGMVNLERLLRRSTERRQEEKRWIGRRSGGSAARPPNWCPRARWSV